VEGCTGRTGADAYNQALSTDRADAVRLALMSRGVASSRVSACGYGEAYPVGSNSSATGRQLNRRVEIRAVRRARPAQGPLGLPLQCVR